MNDFWVGEPQAEGEQDSLSLIQSRSVDFIVFETHPPHSSYVIAHILKLSPISPTRDVGRSFIFQFYGVGTADLRLMPASDLLHV